MLQIQSEADLPRLGNGGCLQFYCIVVGFLMLAVVAYSDLGREGHVPISFGKNVFRRCVFVRLCIST